MLFTDLLESGELGAFLRDNGWQAGPLPTSGRRVKFDVPFSLNQAPSMRELVTA